MTDLSFINSCETITDAVNEPEEPEPEVMDSVGGGECCNYFGEVSAQSLDVGDMGGLPSPEVAYKEERQAEIIQQPKVQMRNYFPESWLFETFELDGAIER